MSLTTSIDVDSLTEPTEDARRQILAAAERITAVSANSSELDAWARAELTQCASVARRLFPSERLVRLPDRLLPYVTGAQRLPPPGKGRRP